MEAVTAVPCVLKAHATSCLRAFLSTTRLRKCGGVFASAGEALAAAAFAALDFDLDLALALGLVVLVEGLRDFGEVEVMATRATGQRRKLVLE